MFIAWKSRLAALLGAAVVAAGCGGGAGSGSGAGTASTEHNPIQLAFSAATPQVDKVPTIEALDALKRQGHDVRVIYLQQSQDPVQSVVRGDVNFGSAATSAVLAAIGQGIPVKAVMEANMPDYVMVAPTSVSSPAALDGLKVGIHAKVSSTAVYTDVALAQYPNVHPKILVVPGSANRIRALAAGQLDASVVQISDLPSLEKLAPGRFHVIYDVAKQNPDLMDAVIFVRSDLLSHDPTLVRQFVAAQLAANRAAYQDPKTLAADIARLVPGVSAKVATDLAQQYTRDGIWPRDGDMSQASVEASLKAMTSSGQIARAPSPSACCDRGPLQAVLSGKGS